MPYLRKPCASRQSSSKLLRGLVYTQGRTIGHIVNVPTIIPLNESRSQPRFPAVEAVMGAERKFQETWVEVQEGATTGRYFVASYYDGRCPVNVALKRLVPDVDWRGELFLMRGGRAVFVTDLGSRRAAERAVRKYLVECLALIESVRRGRRIILPSLL